MSRTTYHDIWQDEISRTFREVVGVPAKPWPDLNIERSNELTGEVYMNPVFEATVAHPENHKLFCEVMKQVESQLIKNSKSLPSALTHKELDFIYGRDLLYEMTKTSFRSCKAQWHKQTDAAGGKQDLVNQRVNRWRERRITKSAQLEKAIVPYAAKRDVPPQVIKNAFVHEQYMSDEASGPEDNDDTSKAVWKTRMALKRGFEHDTDKEFLEVLTCDWRSDEMAEGLHEMQQIAFPLLTAAQKKGIHYERVRGTGRRSSRVPDRAPLVFPWPWLKPASQPNQAMALSSQAKP
ncbi:hypothetical protein MVEN_00140200 [Mycena venus]|uniref:Uncharacterized protein n=1 Tax=Mycena venus TaxID=2733690 RepID=A0A8H6Z0N2_9AGAR|nr:hypothetical protein MVEN_00140200 [Mycena venus]